MAVRWCAAGLVEASKQFRKVNGFLHLPALRRALDAEVAKLAVTPPSTIKKWLESHGSVTEVPRGPGHPLLASVGMFLYLWFLSFDGSLFPPPRKDGEEE